MARKALETRNKEEEKETINIKSIESKLDKYLERKVDELTQSLSRKVDERIEFKTDKFLKEETRKINRKNSFRIIRLNVLILILLCIVCYFGYCLYDVDYFHIRTIVLESPKESTDSVESTEESSEESTEEEKPIDKEALISEHRYLLDNLMIEDEAILDMFKNNSTNSNLSNQLKLKIAYKNLDKSSIKIENDVVSFELRYLEEASKEIFGENSTLKGETFTYNKTRFMYYNGMFIGLNENNKSEVDVLTKIVDINITEDKLQLNVIFAEIVDGALLNENGDVIVKDYNSEDLSNYKDKLSNFLIIFDKSRENYIFSSIEKNVLSKGVV